MFQDLFLHGLAELFLEAFHLSAQAIHLAVTSVQTAATCPRCGQPARRVHSRYARQVADVPCAGIPVTWTLKARRFFCDHPACPKTTFAERLPTIVAVWARRSDRLAVAQLGIGLSLGGEPGSRLARRLGLATSPDTLLRLIRRTPDPAEAGVRVLGVDDWAWRRGQRYGTLLVDLEQRRPVDLLPDRTAEALVAWLQAHPGVEVISRDRGGAYADGARRGAPDAVQVADRWHLLRNLADTLERLFDRQPASLRAATAIGGAAEPAPQPDATISPEKPPSALPPTVAATPTQIDISREARRAKRLARYEAVRQLDQQGVSQRVIARQLKIGRGTIRRYVNANTFPEIAQRPQASSILDPFLPYLVERWQAGCHNGVQLWREIRARGYTGSRPLLSRWVAHQRRLLPTRPKPAAQGQWPRPIRPPPAPRPLASRRAAFLVLKPPEELDADQRATVKRFCQASPDVATASDLARQFADMVRSRRSDRLDTWLEGARTTNIRELKHFAQGLQRDYAAVAAGLSLPWSAGPTEGHINRLKTLKRQMYGKAGFDLLRQRVLNRV